MANWARRFDASFLQMFDRIRTLAFPVLATLVVIADPGWAFRPEEPQAQVRTLWVPGIIASPPAADGHIDIAAHLERTSGKTGRAIGSKSRAWQDFVARTGKGWLVRWNPITGTPSSVVSACVVAGSQGPGVGHPANVRVNMGAYGGTAQASRTPVGWSLLADLTNDGIVDFMDLGHWAENWLGGDFNRPADFDRNAIVNLPDYAPLVHDWLAETNWH